MKTKLFILILTAFMAAGCGSGGSSDDSVTTPPISDNPGDENPDKPDDGEPVTPNPPPVKVETVGWYLRTTAVARLSDGTTLVHNTAGVFGELDESEEGKDKHDIASYGKAAFQVRFLNENIEDGVQYFSDYRKYDGIEEKKVWTFVIVNEKVDNTTPNLANAEIKIDVEQMREVLRKEGDPFYIEKVAKSTEDKRQQLTLIDIDNQRMYTYDELKTANLSMDGLHTRTFRWVLGTADQSDMQPLSATMGIRSIEKTAADEFAIVKTADSSKFGMPPQ